VTIAPPTIEQIEEAARFTKDTNFTLSIADSNAVIHTLAAIAQQHDLSFAIVPTPPADVVADSWKKSAEFTIANDVVSESSLILSGSGCPDHEIKSISLHLRGDQSPIYH
jgi:hypothetical protein